jgi:DNA-3-methyladenine glycosylase II
MTFLLEPVPPFGLDLTAWAIRRRPENLMDRWDGKSYRRVLAIDADAVGVTVTQSGGKTTPQLHVVAIAAGRGVPKKARVAAAIERLLGTCVDLRPFYRFAAGEPRLHELAARFRGLKPPRFPTVFEALVNGIACQQLSLAVGITLLNRLSAKCGLSFPDADGVQYAFPRPADLAAMNIEDLLPLGFSRNKSRAIIETASKVAEGRLDLESFANLENEEALARLRELRGVGRWTAEYVLLRGLGRTNLFPGDDVGARNNLSRWMHLRKPLDYDRVGGVLRKWKPFAGLIYFHLLLSGLEQSGKLPADASVGDRLTSRRYGSPRVIGN